MFESVHLSLVKQDETNCANSSEFALRVAHHTVNAYYDMVVRDDSLMDFSDVAEPVSYRLDAAITSSEAELGQVGVRLLIIDATSKHRGYCRLIRYPEHFLLALIVRL